MSESTGTEAQLSEAEKRKLLRERRQAKMAKGNASSRLNTILSQGASVTTQVTSVLDKSQESTESEEQETPSSSSPASADTTSLPSHHDDDPDIQDITSIATQTFASPTPPIGEETPEDIDEIFRKVFQQASAASGLRGSGGIGAGGAPGDLNDPMAQFMKMFTEGANDSQSDLLNAAAAASGGAAADPTANKYQTELYAYNVYQQNLWKFRFLIVRYLFTGFNFFYHFFTIPDQLFHASSHPYVRGLVSPTPLTGFITWFFTAEVLIVASYYMISVKTGIFNTKHENHLIMKGISLGSMFLPQLTQIRPYISRGLAYYDLIGIVLGDLSLVVVLFGLLSFIR